MMCNISFCQYVSKVVCCKCICMRKRVIKDHLSCMLISLDLFNPELLSRESSVCNNKGYQSTCLEFESWQFISPPAIIFSTLCNNKTFINMSVSYILTRCFLSWLLQIFLCQKILRIILTLSEFPLTANISWLF